MKKFIPSLLIAGTIALLLTGCRSAPSKFYTLDATAQAGDASSLNCAVLVGPVFIPAAVDRPQFVVTAKANEVEVQEFNRWAAPLDENISRVVALNLGRLLGTSRAASAPLPDFGPAYRITLRVERFDCVAANGKIPGRVNLEVQWVIRNPDGRGMESGRSTAQEILADSTAEAFAAAQSQALAKVSCDLAAAIRVCEATNK